MRRSPRARLAAAALVAAAAGVQLLHLLLWDPWKLARYAIFRDDALFYATIAENFHRLGFLTFDGQMPTNGVQPLWMAALLACKAVFPGADAVALLARLSWASYLVFAFLGSLLVLRGEERRLGSGTGLAVFAALLLLNPAFQHFAIRGFEVPILLVALAWLLLAVERADRALAAPGARLSPARLAELGLASALCFLARTNLFWLCPAALGWLLLRERRLRPAQLVFPAVAGAVVLPYLAWNALRFGSAVPISGRVKLYYLELAAPTFADYWRSEEWHGLFDAFASSVAIGQRFPMALVVPLVLCLLLPLLALAWRSALARGRAPRLPASLQLLGLALLPHLLFMYGWYRELRPYSSYYFVCEVVFAALALAWWAARRPRATVAVAALALIAAGSALRFATLEPSAYWRSHLAAVRDVAALPEGASVGAYWPGALGALSGRAVIPLDGIVGSQRFFEQRVRTGSELDDLLSRPDPVLAIYLHERPEALFASAREPALRKWNRLGELHLWRYRACGPEVVARHPVQRDGTGWYLIRFDTERLPGCVGAPVAAHPNLIAVVIDTLRPDDLDLYGASEETAPFLRRLGAESAVFANAFSTSSWTAPATASLFTGVYPMRHGVTFGIHAHKRLAREVAETGGASLRLDRIADDLELLPEHLRDLGYSTFGVSTNLNVGKEMGFERGFDRFVRRNMASADWVRKRVLRWRRELLRAAPFFLYLHLNDVHAPYEGRAPWYQRRADEHQDIRAAYRSEIRYVDGVLRELCAALDPEDRALLAIVSDHGEEFWERGRLGHLFTLHGEVNRVLLLIHGPAQGVRAQWIEQNASLVDVLPTLLELVGGAVPPGLDGVSLAPLLRREPGTEALARSLASRPLAAERLDESGSGRELQSLVRGRWKLIRGPEGEEQLYDLRADPGELHDRSRAEPERTRELAAQLRELWSAGRRSAPARGEIRIDARRLEQLRRLGYVEEEAPAPAR